MNVWIVPVPFWEGIEAPLTKYIYRRSPLHKLPLLYHITVINTDKIERNDPIDVHTRTRGSIKYY